MWACEVGCATPGRLVAAGSWHGGELTGLIQELIQVHLDDFLLFGR